MCSALENITNTYMAITSCILHFQTCTSNWGNDRIAPSEFGHFKKRVRREKCKNGPLVLKKSVPLCSPKDEFLMRLHNVVLYLYKIFKSKIIIMKIIKINTFSKKKNVNGIR